MNQESHIPNSHIPNESPWLINNESPNRFPKMHIDVHELMYEVSVLLRKAEEHLKNTISEYVNWKRLRVSDIEYRISVMYGELDPYCIVVIRGAKPDSVLVNWVCSRLDHKKFPNTYIECE